MFKKKLQRLMTVGCAGCLACWNILSAADYSAWSHNTGILINTSSSGTAIAQTVCNFPVLIRLTQTNFTFSQTKAGGADLRFSASNGTPLPYQIERWDATQQLADIWVKVDNIYPNQASQGFLMHWGNTNALSESNSRAVFDTSNGFVGVWHMADTSDATLNNNHASNFTGPGFPKDSSGVIGRSYFFDGCDDRLDIPFSQSLNVGMQFSVSLWLKYQGGSAPTNGDYSTLFWRKQGWQTSIGWGLELNADGRDNGVTFVTINGTSNYKPIVVNSWSAAEWHYLSAFYKDDSLGVFCDGLKKATYFVPEAQNIEIVYKKIDSICTPVVFEGETLSWDCSFIYDSSIIVNNGPYDCDLPLWIGAPQAGSEYTSDQHTASFFIGKFDEVRYEKGVRSADWIKLCYENQKANQSLVTVGGQIGVIQRNRERNAQWSFDTKGSVVAILFDLQGRIVMNIRIDNGARFADSDHLVASFDKKRQRNLQSGIYMVQLFDEGMHGVITQKKSVFIH